MEISISDLVNGKNLKYDPERDNLVECRTLTLVGHAQSQSQRKCNLRPVGEPIDVTENQTNIIAKNKARHLEIVK